MGARGGGCVHARVHTRVCACMREARAFARPGVCGSECAPWHERVCTPVRVRPLRFGMGVREGRAQGGGGGGGGHVHVRACVHVCVCARLCVHVCVRTHACVSVHIHMSAQLRDSAHVPGLVR